MQQNNSLIVNLSGCVSADSEGFSGLTYTCNSLPIGYRFSISSIQGISDEMEEDENEPV